MIIPILRMRKLKNRLENFPQITKLIVKYGIEFYHTYKAKSLPVTV